MSTYYMDGHVGNIIYTGGKYGNNAIKSNTKNKTKNKTMGTRKNVTRRKKYVNVNDSAFIHFNRGWLNRRKIPKSRVRTDIYSILQTKIDRQIANIVKDCSSLSKSHNKLNCWRIYNSHFSTPVNVINDHMKESYTKLCYILCPENKLDVYNLYGFFIRNDISMPFSWCVSQDSRNRFRYENHLYDSGLSLPDKDYYLLNKHAEKIVEYKKFISNMFVHVFGKNHVYDIDSILEVESIFAKYTPTDGEKQNSEKNYVKVTSNTLATIGLDWERFSRVVGYSSAPSHIILNTRNYFERVFSFINNNWTTDKMRSYWVFKMLLSFSDYNKDMRKIRFDFFGRYLNGIKNEVSKKTVAVDTVCQYMNTYISNEYLNQLCNPEIVKRVEDMSILVRTQFLKRLENNDWLTEKTKTRALKKLKSMKFYIGSKRGFIEDPDVEFKPNDMYANMLIFVSWEITQMVQMSSRKYDTSIWNRFEMGNVYDVNAYYIPNNNEMVLPCGILQPPFVDDTEGIEYALALLGTTVGHELTHGLDDDGCKYDYNGDYVNWWSPTDMKNYKIRQNDLVKVYKKMVVADGYEDIDHRLSLGENIADIGGLVICEDVLNSIYRKRGMSEEERKRSFKTFYRFYAHSWRSKMTREYKQIAMKTDEHMYSKYRCDGSLMNSHNFRECYGLKIGDKMFNKNIVDIW